MMTIVENLIIFHKDKDISKLSNDIQQVGFDHFYVICVKILGWLQAERRRTLLLQEGRKVTYKPLRLNEGSSWSKSLEYIVNNDSEYKKYFAITDDGMIFNENLPANEVENARIIAFEKYEPIVHILRRNGRAQ